jgi:hypothetical protein
MPTSYSDQFYELDPANPPPVGSAVTFVVHDFIDEDDDGDIDSGGDDSVNGSDVTASWPGDTVTINVPGVGNVTYTGTTFYTADGARYFTPTDGQVLQNGTWVSSSFVTGQGPLDVGELGPACFTTGALITTKCGLIPVEALKVGDMVRTLDRGFQPIRWIGSSTLCGRGLFKPVRIARGALGNKRALIVSPQHRFLISGWRAEMMFGESQLLVAAKHLCHSDQITRAPKDEVTYWHILFDQHEIVFAEGIPSESFDPQSDMARRVRHALEDTSALFPWAGYSPSQDDFVVRPTLKAHEAASIIQSLCRV